MNSLSHLLGASARMDLLRALYYQFQPVGLRHLSRLADVHPYSAERTLKELVKDGLVKRTVAGSRVMFMREASHPDWELLEAVLESADRAEINLRSQGLSERARSLLPFIEEACGMLKQARRSIHVS